MNWGAQQEAAIKAVKDWIANPGRKQTFYLAGYAGTGKTTIAKALAEDAGKVQFAAFTGKAAMVLTGKGCPASTIHSLIYKPKDVDRADGPVFVLNPESAAAEADLIVIDEVSMVGEALGRDLLSFGVPVLVLGDPAQLPPVGDGAGFFTRHEPDFMLTEIHRQARDNPIIDLATTVREGGRLELGAYGTSLVINRDQLGQKKVIAAEQVLCGLNKTRRSLNAKIRSLMGRDSAFFVEGERVVALRNDSETGILNGSIWSVDEVEFSDQIETTMTVRPLDPGMGKVPRTITTHHAWLHGKEHELPYRKQREYVPFDYGYALSVHKAQGSQWDDVLIFDESESFREDRARWLYTAITRAAVRVTVVI